MTFKEFDSILTEDGYIVFDPPSKPIAGSVRQRN